jgi:phosphatidylinositol 4-kinase
MHDMESMRSSAGRPSSLVTYFLNGSLNKNVSLGACMESIAEKVPILCLSQINLLRSLSQVIRGSVSDLNMQASEQALPADLPQELRQLLVMSTHRVEKARDIANKYLDRLIMSFPSLMCDPLLVVAILEVLTMMSRACEDEFTDEVPRTLKCLRLSLTLFLVQPRLRVPFQPGEHHSTAHR